MGTSDRSADSSGEGAAKPIPPGRSASGSPRTCRGGRCSPAAAPLALSALLAACGGDDDDAVTDTTSGGADTTAAPPTQRRPGPPAATGGPPRPTPPSTARHAAAEAQTETITIGLQSLQEQYVDPHFAVGGLIFPLLWAISDTLYRLDENAQYVPGLATDYEISDDKLTWTFTLRDDVMMQDGTPFTAADVKTAVDRIVAGADFTHLATFKSYVTGATVVDDTHVQVIDEQAVRHARHRHAGADPDRLLQPGRRRRVPQDADGRRGVEVRLAGAERRRQLRALRRLLGRHPQAELQEPRVPDRARRVEPRRRRPDRRPRHRVRHDRRRRRRSSRATTSSRSSRRRRPASPTSWRSTTSSRTRTRRSRTSTSARR